MADLKVVDSDVLNCRICFLPLKPPIFQCDVGHVVCSRCHGKLEAAGKCHVCGVVMAGGFRRCHDMETTVESVRGPCPNAAYGCDATPAYHAREEHALVCRHAPCHCPGEACGFVGSVAALMDHVAGVHGWPCKHTWVSTFSELPFSGHLRVGFNFIVGTNRDENDDKYLFLLNVTRRPFCRAVSVICIRPTSSYAAAGKKIEFQLSHSRSWSRNELLSHDQTTHFRVACSDLSGGLPGSNSCHQLIVPTTHGDGGDDLEVKVDISIYEDYNDWYDDVQDVSENWYDMDEPPTPTPIEF
ncbi:unnamed protein product [Urochloa humidicola]